MLNQETGNRINRCSYLGEAVVVFGYYKQVGYNDLFIAGPV